MAFGEGIKGASFLGIKHLLVSVVNHYVMCHQHHQNVEEDSLIDAQYCDGCFGRK